MHAIEFCMGKHQKYKAAVATYIILYFKGGAIFN